MAVCAFDLEGVSQHYQAADRKLPILHSISLKIYSGEFLAIMGPSGSGKSTLLNILGCLEPASVGTLRVFGHDVSKMNDDEISALRAKTIGFIFQAFHLLPAYDAISNVSIAALYADVANVRERAIELLSQVGLAHRLDHKPAALSGGEKQRVAIARCLINEPKIILADEPTGSLDQKSGQEILSLLSVLHRQGKTIILITHDPQVAAQAGRIIEVVDGKIVLERQGRHQS